jgi:hypothetical protein
MATDNTDLTLQPISSSPQEYFANLETRQCAFEIWARIEEYYNEMRRTGRLALYRNSYTNYYMGWIYRASMYRSGEMGEMTRSFWNHERNLLRHLKIQTVQNKIAFKSQVLNSNSKSSNIVEFSNGLADHYSTSPQYALESKTDQSVEDTLVWGESAIVGLWNKFKGDPVAQDPSTGQILKDGDMEYFNVTPMDRIVNCTHQSRDQIQWQVIRRWVNKYDLAAMYPQLAERVTQFTDSESSYATKLVSLMHHDNETIPIFYFFHDKTAAVPMGRLLLMADPDCILEDGPLDQGEGKKGYDHVPVYDNVVETMQGSPYGYTVAFDLIPLQQELNELVSAVTTNNINFATQCVMAMKGSNLQYQELASGMNFIEYDSKVGQFGKPEALNLLHSQPETYQLIDKILQNMETLAGINSMMRGNPDANVTSGQYAALVTVQSVIFNSGLQKAYSRQVENIMTGTIKTLRKNMIGKKVAKIVGVTSEPYLKDFTSAELADIESISVELTNPMLQTPAGKMQMADNLMKTGLIKDPKQYIGVFTDGDLPQLYKRQETQLRLVKQENEALLQGKMFECAITDDHVMHILEHTPNIDTIESRLNPNSPNVVAALSHIQSHIDQLAGNAQHGPINPILAGIIGDPTLPPGTPNALVLPPMQPGQPPMGAGATNQPPPTNAGQPQPPQNLPPTGMPGPNLGVI